MESEKKSLEEKNRKIAIAYAKYLKEHDLQPGDATFMEPETLGKEVELEVSSQLNNVKEPIKELHKEPVPEVVNESTEAEKKKTKAKRKKEEERRKKQKKQHTKTVKPESRVAVTLQSIAAAPIFLLDKIVDKIDERSAVVGSAFVKSAGKIISTYKASRRTIGRAVLAVCLLCGVMLVVFDKFTVYEYAYNGKVLGYVDNQDDVTNVLQVASEQLNEVNEDDQQDIEFTANDNISFKLVRAAGQDTDDADTTVNKLAYMTDIEVEAFGIYEGGKLSTIVKSEAAAERVLSQVKSTLGTPDKGMDVVSVEFNKEMAIRPINILLTSVQSTSVAQSQMTKGGNAKYYRLVEDGETISDIASQFGVGVQDIYDEENKKSVNSVESGDKVCIRKTVDPASIKLVEEGRMRESVPYETVTKKSKDYYIGDKIVDVEGENGIQIFDGTLTKIGGKVVERQVDSVEVIKEKVDEVILVGTAERPKTAPTGTFHNPMVKGTYIVTSRPGWRWGRTHEGVDMAGSIGTHVFASDGGTVIRASVYSGYGNCIDIEHANGYITRYGHLSYIGVRVGQKVYQGEYIGNVGSTGHSTGPHLHFEIRRNGVFTNPDNYVVGGL